MENQINQMDEQENPCFKRIQLWTAQETRLLLEKYATHFPEIGPTKAIKNRKEMWEKIATAIDEDRQRRGRSTVFKRKKVDVDNNNSAPRSRIVEPEIEKKEEARERRH
ncbi:uncharacterized protein LOC120781999 [Bactrocera tryoni]|uniref:uncharacterized protein LOC120781999 n=1 Tax=Bactrocera tryoni TaxID=59916 RepID=UPI001A96655A|nr:uncharacterized protein LOC120781999 [Bactrocera tryoni]